MNCPICNEEKASACKTIPCADCMSLENAKRTYLKPPEKMKDIEIMRKTIKELTEALAEPTSYPLENKNES